MKAVDYDDQKFVRRIQKYRECRLNKRVLQSKWFVVGKITIKIKAIGISSIGKKNKKNNAKEAPEENNDGMIADTKDSILNLPAVVSLPTTENIMKHTEVDEPAASNDVAGVADVTEGDMEDVEAGERRDDAIKVIDSKSIDAEGNEAVKELLEKGECNVSNGQEMNQSKDKPSTELIPDDTEILDKGGGRKEKTVRMGERVII